MYSGSDPLRQAVRDCAIVAAIAGIALFCAHAARAVRAPSAPGHLVVAGDDPAPPPPDPAILRVCADPNNLPFSNDHQQGFENDIAAIVARELGRRVEYYWQPQRRGFIRTTLNAGWCDLVAGVPSNFELALPTAPYYRSTYVFVSRRGAADPIRSLDDARLRRVRIGVEMTGEDYENPPAVQALADRHIIDNLRPYLVYGDYSRADPPRGVIDAVAKGDVDVAIAWGPLAGYFGALSNVPLALSPVTPERPGPGLRFTYGISMAVRRGDRGLRDAVNGALAARQREIQAVLARFHVPLVEGASPKGARS